MPQLKKDNNLTPDETLINNLVAANPNLDWNDLKNKFFSGKTYYVLDKDMENVRQMVEKSKAKSTSKQKSSTSQPKPSTTQRKASATQPKPSATQPKPSTTQPKPSTTQRKASASPPKPSPSSSIGQSSRVPQPTERRTPGKISNIHSFLS